MAPEAAAAAPKPVHFQGRDFDTVTRIADLIIPRTETPGATDAGAQFFIDQAVYRNPQLQSQFTTGLESLNRAAKAKGKADFLALTEAEQISVLEGISSGTATPEEKFFVVIKNLTIDGYYKSEAGMVKELGYHGNAFRSEFPGCTHPEHWPTAQPKQAAEAPVYPTAKEGEAHAG